MRRESERELGRVYVLRLYREREREREREKGAIAREEVLTS